MLRQHANSQIPINHTVFSMVILSINSVINPILYNDVIVKYSGKLFTRTNTLVTGFVLSMRSRGSASNVSDENPPQENIEMQE